MGQTLSESLVLNINKKRILGKIEFCPVDDYVGMTGNVIFRKLSGNPIRREGKAKLEK
jgi:hypothetical protein